MTDLGSMYALQIKSVTMLFWLDFSSKGFQNTKEAVINLPLKVVSETSDTLTMMTRYILTSLLKSMDIILDHSHFHLYETLYSVESIYNGWS